jgi:hypothetical protein
LSPCDPSLLVSLGDGLSRSVELMPTLQIVYENLYGYMYRPLASHHEYKQLVVCVAASLIQSGFSKENVKVLEKSELAQPVGRGLDLTKPLGGHFERTGSSTATYY